MSNKSAPAPSVSGSSNKSGRNFIVNDCYANDELQYQQREFTQNKFYRPASYTYNDRDMGLVVDQPQYAGDFAAGALYEPDTSGHPPVLYVRPEEIPPHCGALPSMQAYHAAEPAKQGSGRSISRLRQSKGKGVPCAEN